MSARVGQNFTRVSATAQITPADHPAVLERILVEASSSGTITLRNGGSAGTLVISAWAVAAGDVIEVGLEFSRGVHHTEGGTSLIATFVWR